MPSIISRLRAQEARTRIKDYFENIKDEDFELTSPFDPKYNCIAHAAGENNKWWWSVDKTIAGNDVFWLNNIPGQATLENFILAFKNLGYSPCDDSELETGFEKVGIYVSRSDETPTHMARQLSDGTWTSKVGDDVDISHKTLQSIEGKRYGIVKQILRRRIEQ